MEEALSVDQLISLIDREGGYVNHPADKGGPTCFGVTEAVARAHGYAGPMRNLPRAEAAAIYRRIYWLRPRFDEVARRSPNLAAELFDTGVNMGPAVAATFVQRALTALNRNSGDYPDLVPDGRIAERTLGGPRRLLRGARQDRRRNRPLRALEALQGERYLRLAERRPGIYLEKHSRADRLGSKERLMTFDLTNPVFHDETKARDISKAALAKVVCRCESKRAQDGGTTAPAQCATIGAVHVTVGTISRTRRY